MKLGFQIRHLDTKTCENRVYVEKSQSYPLRKDQTQYQTCVIAARAIAAVRPIGEGALLAALLVTLLKINGGEKNKLHPSEQTDENKQT